MSNLTLTPTKRVSTTTLAKAYGPVPSDEQWSVDVRVVNIDAAATPAPAFYTLQIRKSDGTGAGYSCFKMLVPPGAPPFDVEHQLVLPAGWEIWDSASSENAVSVRFTGTKLAV